MVAAAFALSAYSLNYLPDTIITHWGISGEANGFMDKATALAIIPTLMIVFAIVLYFIPNIDPLKKNIESFRKEYDLFIAVFCGFLLYLHIITIALNFGVTLNIGQLLSPAFALLFFFIGVLLAKSKRNFFIGIRTPWTLSSDEIWNKTHKLGAKLFKASGIICLLGVIYPEGAIIFVLVPVIASAVWTMTYSYKEFSYELKRKAKQNKKQSRTT